MAENRPPRHRCRACGRHTWWRLKRLTTGGPGDWICGTCHPPGPEPERIEWGREQPTFFDVALEGGRPRYDPQDE